MANQRFARIHSKLRPAASGRKAWLVMIDAARTAAARATGTSFSATAGSAELALDIRHLLTRTKAMDFPVQNASAVHLAGSFLEAMRAYADASMPEVRALCAPVMRAGATALMDMLEDLRAEEASNSWMKRMPASERP